MPDQAVDITFDGYSLQDATIITSTTEGDDSPPRKSSGIYELPVLHGGKKTFEKFLTRRIKISGKIKSPTASGLMGKIEELNEVSAREEKVLQFSYPDNFKRIFTASVEEPPVIHRSPWSLNLAEFEMTFIALEPWSVRTQTAISGVYNILGAITSLSVGISGTLDPQPSIFFHTTASGSKFYMSNNTTREGIEVPVTFSGTGRNLLIDNYNFKVQLDGEDVNFKGSLNMDFKPGVNDLTIVTVGHSGSSLDQFFQDTTLQLVYTPFGNNVWRAQSFKPTLPKLLFVELYLANNGQGQSPDITVEIRSNSGSTPSSTVLATATIEGFDSQTPAWRRAVFTSPLTVTPETTYWIVMRCPDADGDSVYRVFYYATSSQYSRGNAAWTVDDGVSWATNAYDRLFRTYGDLSTALTGRLIIQYNPRRW